MTVKKVKESVNGKFVPAVMFALKGECNCLSCEALRESADSIIKSAQDPKKKD